MVPCTRALHPVSETLSRCILQSRTKFSKTLSETHGPPIHLQGIYLLRSFIEVVPRQVL